MWHRNRKLQESATDHNTHDLKAGKSHGTEFKLNADLLTGGIDSAMIDDEVDARLNISMYS